MSKVVGEKSNYVLTPISSAAYNKGVSLAGGFSAVGNISKKAIITLLTFVILLSGIVVGTAQTSKAANADMLSDWFCNSGFNSAPYDKNGRGSTETSPEQSIGSVFGLDYAVADKKLTAYEKFGGRGTNYTTWRSLTNTDGNAGKDVTYTKWDGSATVEGGTIAKNSPYWSANLSECLGATGGFITGVSNFELGITEIGTAFINTIYVVAFYASNAVFAGMYTVIDGIVIKLRDTLFIPFVELFVILGALWMAWQGLVKRKSTEALTGAIWMIGAAVAGGILLSNPSYIPATTTFITTQLNGTVSNIITGAAADSSASNKALCSVDAPLDVTDNTDAGKEVKYSVDTAARQTQCSIWYNLVYVPWVVGQYGVAPTEVSDNAKNITEIKPGTVSANIVSGIPVTLGNYKVPTDQLSWPLLQLNAQADNPDLHLGLNNDGSDPNAPTSAQQYLLSVNSAAANHELAQVRNSEWAGQGTLTRLNAAGASMWAMLGTGILVVVFGFEMLALQLSMVFLVLMMPIFLLVGVHPGMGRRISMRWLELLTNITIKQVMLGVLLSVFLLFYALVMGSGIWLIQNILIIAITIVGLSYKSKMMGLFANVDFGGDKSLQEPGAGASQGAKRLLAAGAGAAVGAVAAGAGAAALAPAAAGMASSVTGAAVGVDNGQGGATGDTASPTAAVAPTAGNTSAPTVTSSDVEKTRIDNIRKSAIKKGALMGAANGFSSGTLGAAAFTAGNTGYMIGDGAFDNEADYQRNKDQESTNRQMIEEIRKLRETDSATPPSIQEWIEQNRKDS